MLIDDIFGAPGWGDSDQEDAPVQGSHAACSTDPLPPDVGHPRPSPLRVRFDNVDEGEWGGMNKKQRKSAIQQSRAETSSAAAALTSTPPTKRAIFEFWCAENSKIGEYVKDDPDCV
eukprot:3300973-Heterocapsa_arctica.AAC.1